VISLAKKGYVKLRFLKDYIREDFTIKKGEIIDTKINGHKPLVKDGIAEYVEKPKIETKEEKKERQATVPPTFDEMIGNIDKQQLKKKIKMIPEDWIWWYYDQGFSIIPLGRNKGFWNNKKNQLKKPSLKSWNKYKNTKATKEEIQQWIDKKLFVNIGTICGHVSGDLVIIDIDDETIPEILKLKSEKILKSGAWFSKTGNGFQFWLKHHSNPGGIKRPLKYKIEYRANNGYCVVPPSTHPNGKTYTFIGVKDYKELPELVEKDVKSIFNEFKERIGKKWDIKKTKHTYKGTTGTDTTDSYPKCIEIALKSTIKHPMRYFTIYGILSCFVMKRIPKDMAMKRIKQFNMEKCVPPHKNSIVEQAVHGAYGLHAHLYGCEFWMDDAELCPYEDIMECPYGAKKAKRELLKKYHVFNYKEKKDKEGKKYYVKDTVICPNMGELIYNEFDYNFKTILDTMEIYYYEDGVYHGGGEKLIYGLVKEFLDTFSNEHIKNEVKGHIRDSMKSFIYRKDFVSPPHLINCNNGIFDIETDKFMAHTPEYLFLNKIRANYDADAKSKDFEIFVQQIASKKGERREELEDTIQEHIGYGLYNKWNFDNFIVLDGGGRNGKTTLFEILEAFYGSDNICAVSLQDLNNRPFALHKLFGMMANISDDLSPKAVKDSGTIKKITGGSPLWADVKHSKDGIRFTNTSKQWFACNQLPPVSDMSDAFYGRMMHITFLNRYVKEKDKKEIDNKRVFADDPDLLDNLITEKNLSAMLNYGITGLRRLLKNKDFSYPTSVDERRDIYLKKSNPLFAFVEEECEIGNQDWCMIVADIYKAVNDYCDRNSLNRIPSVHALTKGLNNMGIGIIKTRRRIDGERTDVWIGIRSMIDDTINHYVGTKELGQDDQSILGSGF